jgi:hypothetical protein
MNLRHSRTSGRATSARHDRGRVHDHDHAYDHDRRGRVYDRRGAHDRRGRVYDRRGAHDRRAHDRVRRTLALETVDARLL